MPSKAFITLTVALLISSLTACMQDVNSQLVEAGRQGDARNIEGLLAAGAEVDAKDEKDITALLYASSEGHSASVEALLDAGADVDAQANDGMTALMVVAKGNTDIARALLEAGANVDAIADHGVTARMMTERNGYIEIAELLEKAGAGEQTPQVPVK